MEIEAQVIFLIVVGIAPILLVVDVVVPMALQAVVMVVPQMILMGIAHIIPPSSEFERGFLTQMIYSTPWTVQTKYDYHE